MKEYNHEENNLIIACGFDEDTYTGLITGIAKEGMNFSRSSERIQEIDKMTEKYPALRRIVCMLAYHKVTSLVKQFIQEEGKGCHIFTQKKEK